MAEIPRYMDGKKCLDIASCLPVVLRTCTCVKPSRNEPMALSLPIFSWPRACGTLKRNAPTVCIVYNCGRADDSQTAERLRKLAHSILKRCAPEEIVEQAPQWRLIEAWPYGGSLCPGGCREAPGPSRGPLRATRLPYSRLC